MQPRHVANKAEKILRLPTDLFSRVIDSLPVDHLFMSRKDLEEN